MFFGDLSLFSPKKMDYIKIGIGADSKVTNTNTTLNVELHMEDRFQKYVYRQFGSTSYIQNVMKAKDHPDGATMFDRPIDIIV